MSATTKERRSGRERKPAAVFVSVKHPSQKRKRSPESDEDDERDEEEKDDEGELSDPISSESEEEEDDEPAFAPTKSTPAKASGKARGTKAPAPKKARMAPKAATSRPRKTKLNIDASAVAKEAAISDDNALFNALLNPSTALDATVQDFLDSFQESSDAALADLVNCVFRACGCNSSVNSDEVVDSDGVVEFLNDLIEEIKSTESQGYPLASKSPAFRKFRKSLSEFFGRLVSSAAETGVLYTSDLIPTLQDWVVAMSSAQLRSFRHTATVVALEVESALAIRAAAIEKEAEVVSRQRDTERKRRGAGSGNKLSEREKTLATKAAEIKTRKTKINEFLREFFDGVFVHRYRDADAGIRAECVREMGVWLKKHPAHFLEGNYLRYVGWVLSDSNTNVRLEAVKSLLSLYSKADYLITLQHFTERFKPRLIIMATSDTDLAVRVAVIQVLGAIDSNGLLEEDQRETLCLLVYDQEPKVRKAVSGFVRGVWEEAVNQRLVGRRGGNKEKDKERAGVKALASMLVTWERALNKDGGLQAEESQTSIDDSQQDEAAAVKERQSKEIAVLGTTQKSRTTLAVEALWDEVDLVRDWEVLLGHVLLDHSAQQAEDLITTPAKRRKKGKPSSAATPRKGAAGGDDEDEDGVEEAWRLEEAEETLLVEVLLASLKKSIADSITNKKSDREAVQSHMTRVLIKALPKLFTKHQTDVLRIGDILLIPQLMNLELYLEMRAMTAFSTLWDDISKQFLTHSAPIVLNSAMATIRYLLDTATLANTNSTKILELEDELSTSLRDAIAGRDELETATFDDDETLALGAIAARVATLFGSRDMTGWMEEDEGGKQSSAWDIFSALVERGSLGRREEEIMVEKSLQVLGLHLAWKARTFSADEEAEGEEENQARDAFKEQRNSLLAKTTEYVIGSRSNVTEGVKRTAFQLLVNIHVLFAPTDNSKGRPALAPLSIEMDDRLQHQCAGFIQAEAERFADELAELENADDGSESDDTIRGTNDSDDDAPPRASKTARAKRSKKKASPSGGSAPPESRTLLESDHVFSSLVAYFLRAITAGIINVRHSAVLLAYYGRLGGQFDHCVKTIVDVLREEGMYSGNGDAVVYVLVQAIRQSFTMFTDGLTPSEAHSVALAKALSTSLVIRGAQLSIARRLDSKHVVEIHTASLSWVIKRISGYESSNNKKKKADSIEFFRVLHPLLGTIESGEAVLIKSHMDKALADSKIEVPPTAKVWEAQRFYEKRLLTAMSKDKAIVSKSKKGQAKAAQKSAELITSDDDEVIEVEKTTSSPSKRPTRAAAAASQKKQTPRKPPPAKPRPKRIFGHRPEGEPEGSPQRPTNATPSPPPPPSSNRSPMKRRRADSDEDEPEGNPGESSGNRGSSPDRRSSPAPIVAPSPAASQASLADFTSKRKRARR